MHACTQSQIVAQEDEAALKVGLRRLKHLVLPPIRMQRSYQFNATVTLLITVSRGDKKFSQEWRALMSEALSREGKEDGGGGDFSARKTPSKHCSFPRSLTCGHLKITRPKGGIKTNSSINKSGQLECNS